MRRWLERFTWDWITIPGWPPVVSHLGVFAMGVVIAGVFRSTAETPMKVPAKSVIIAMPNDGFAGMDSLRRGDRVQGVRRVRGSGQIECLVSSSPGVLIQGRPRLAVAFGAVAARQVLEAMDRMSVETEVLSLAAEKAVQKMIPCTTGPRVVYGEE